MPNKKLPLSFYRRSDVVQISKELLGKVLCTKISNHPLTCGMIVETEAYCGRNDKACHANDGFWSERTKVMYKAGGVAYVYLCYGIHHLFNVVTNVEDVADAVLVRAIQPLDGVETIAARRDLEISSFALTAGPGRLTQGLGITTQLTETDLTQSTIWIEGRDMKIKDDCIVSSPRIGVDYAGEHAKRLWRFAIKDNKWVSR